jgi:dipeptidyl-peptidase-4
MRTVDSLRAVLTGLVVFLTVASLSAEDATLTVDWIFSEAGKTASSIPDFQWLGDGRIVIYDPATPKAQRTLEVFDPASGKRRDLVDRDKALESLVEVARQGEAEEDPPEELGWPAAFGPHGRWALYANDGDLLLIDLRRSTFSVVANSDREEKSPRFSPDGQKIAFVRDNDLYVFDIGTRSERRLTHDGSSTLLNGTTSWVYWEEVFGRNDRGYAWSPDSRAIAYLQTDESGVGEMHYVDFEPNLPRVIHQRYPKTGEANPKVRAGVVGIDSAETTWIDLGANPYEYLARLKWMPDGRRVMVQTLDRPQTTLDLFLADGGTGEVRHVHRETDPGWINLHDDLHFLDGDRFIWLSERDGYAHLYTYDLNGELERQITRGNWAVHASGGVSWERRAVSMVDEAGGWVYFTGQQKSSIEKQLYRARLDGEGIERVSTEDGVHAITFSEDGDWYVDAHSSNSAMPSLRVFSADGETVRTIAQATPEALAPFDLLPRELMTIPASDGFEMPAMMLKPRDFDPGKTYPVILYVYGGPSAPTVADSWANARPRALVEQILANQGFISVYVDNRSATAISKTLENRILMEGYGSTELADLLDAVAWLKARPFVDPERVGIWGWSGGGAFTLLAMTASKEFKAGIAVAPVTDWRFYDTRWAEAFMKRPQDNPDGYAATSHVDRAGDLHGRLMMVHGTYDDNVHPQNTWAFANELIEAGILFDMMIYPMRKHPIADDAAQKHLYRTMIEFWNAHLK